MALIGISRFKVLFRDCKKDELHQESGPHISYPETIRTSLNISLLLDLSEFGLYYNSNKDLFSAIIG